jgi:uncharacterized protein (TIGR03437 family)
MAEAHASLTRNMKTFFCNSILLTAAALVYGQNTTFQASRISVGCNPRNVATGDFNGDHAPDLAYGCSSASSNPIMLLLGKGDGTFGAPVAVSGPSIGTGTGNKLQAGEFNRDGKGDLAYIAGNGNLIVLLSNGDGTFQSQVTTPANTKLALAAVADLNQKGSDDLIFLSGSNDSLVTYTVSNGDGTFAKPTVIPLDEVSRQVLAMPAGTVQPNSVLTADFNHDGKPDIAVGVKSTFLPSSVTSAVIDTHVILLLSQGGAFTARPTYRDGNTRMIAGDFDGDGEVDLACGGTESAQENFDLYILLKLVKSDGSLAFTKFTNVPSGNALLQAGDFNGEGKSRLVIGSQAFNSLIVYTYDGLQKNQNSGFVELGTTPVDLLVVDLNNDGKPDVVTANTSSSTIALNTTVIPAKVNAALNGASFATGQAIAPGSLASLFGAALTSSAAQASAIPLPMSLSSTSVTVGGVPAPLLYASATQINFQVPWTVPAGPANVVVTANGTALAPLSVTIAAVAPGIFSTQSGSGTAIAINADGSLAAPAGSIPGIATHPALPGDTILILATGLGAVSPSIASGAAADDALRTTNVKPSVLIGGANAQVSFSGLAPQFVGVNQLNVVVPQVNAGVVPLQLESGGIRTTDKVTIAIGSR